MSTSQTNNPRNSEAELDFDPFQETQKALAEMMAAEQINKSHNSGLHAGSFFFKFTDVFRLSNSLFGFHSGRSGHTNGLIHSQNGSHIPPPPPGFVQQQQTHMNSFGMSFCISFSHFFAGIMVIRAVFLSLTIFDKQWFLKLLAKYLTSIVVNF